MFKWLKKTVKRFLGKKGFIKNEFAVAQYSKYDKFSLTYQNEKNQKYVTVKMRIITHDLEKGFSLPDPKKGFGKKKVMELNELINVYEKQFMGSDDQAYKNAVNIIHFYINKADEYGFDISFLETEKYLSSTGYEMLGYKEIPKEKLTEYFTVSFNEFAKSRHSIRKYAAIPLKKEDVIESVKIAQSAPSACNRQSVKIFHVNNAETCSRILEIQNGAKGFSTVNDLFIVAADLSCYMYYQEVNACFVDSGLFAMNFMNSLHYHGIGSCPLLWNDDGPKGQKLRQIVKIPDNYEIALLLTAGYYPEDTVKYACSVRKELDMVYEEI